MINLIALIICWGLALLQCGYCAIAGTEHYLVSAGFAFVMGCINIPFIARALKR